MQVGKEFSDIVPDFETDAIAASRDRFWYLFAYYQEYYPLQEKSVSRKIQIIVLYTTHLGNPSLFAILSEIYALAILSSTQPVFLSS